MWLFAQSHISETDIDTKNGVLNNRNLKYIVLGYNQVVGKGWMDNKETVRRGWRSNKVVTLGG